MSQPRQFSRSRFRRYRKPRLALAKLLLLAVGTPSFLYSQFTYSEDFKNGTAAGWNFYTGDQGPGPRLTSGAAPSAGDPEFGNTVIDPSGQGWLRLTSGNDLNQANAVYFDTPIPSAGNEVTLSFGANMWGGNSFGGTGADGLVFFLYDAAQPFNPGAFGGSLGYAQKTGIDGLGGGFLGVAFDIYGNFSNPTEGRVGGVGFAPNAVVVRGPGDGTTGYEYLAGTTGSSGPSGLDYTAVGDPTTADSGDPTLPALPYVMGTASATTRPNQSTGYRNVEVKLDENSRLIVRMQFGEDGLWYDVMNIDVSSFVRPEQLRIGFSAGTGGGTMVYEVGGLLQIEATAGSGNFMWDNDEGTQVWGTSATNPLNWFGNTNPTLRSNIIFNSAYINTAQNIDLRGSDKVVKNIYFSGPNAYSLYTTEDRRLIFDSDTENGLTTISLTNEVAGNAAHTIGVNLLLNKTLDINNNVTPLFTISGGIDTNGNPLNFKGTGTTLVTGVISGSGAIAKTDIGTARLAGANTYTGATTVGAGTLEISHATALGSTAAGTTVSSGGTLSLAGSGTTFAAEALTLSGNGASDVGALRNREGNNTLTGTISLAASTRVSADAATSLTVNGVISGAAASTLEKTGAGTVVLNAANTYSGATQIRSGTLAISNENNLGANPATTQAAHLLLDGGTLRSQTSAVVLDDSNRGVTLGSAGGTFETATSLTIASAVAGSGTLTKTGASTLTLSGNNSHNGAVNINAGTLAASGGNAIGNTSAVTVSTGATFDITAANETIGSLTGSGATALGTRTLTLGGDNTSTTYAGVASGSGGLTKTGAGTLTLTGANTFTGTATVSAGTLQLGAAGVLADTSTVALSGGTLAIGGNFSETIGSLTLGANSTIDFNNATSTLTFSSATRTAGTLTVDDWAGAAFGGGNSRLVVSSPLSGFTTGANGEFTEISFTGWGAGAVRLASGEIVPYTGGTVYTYALTGGGVWDADNNWSDNDLPANADPASGQFASAAGDTAILGSAATSNATLNLNGANRTLGYLIVNDNNTYTVTGNTLNFDVNAGQAQLVNQGSGGLVLDSAVTLADALTITQTGTGLVDINGAISGTNRNILVAGDGTGEVRFDGAVTTGTGTLTKTGDSTLVLTGTNTFTGATSVLDGVLTIRNENNLGANPGSFASDRLLINGGTLRTEVNAVTIDDANRGVTLGSAGATLDTLSDLAIANVVAGSGTLTKTGSGTLTLSGSGTNTHTGDVFVNAGILDIAKTGGANRGLGNAALVSVSSGATLRFSGGQSETIGSLAGAGTVTNTNATGITLTTGGNNQSTTFSGSLTNSGGALALTKQGTGTFTLSGDNSYTGATTVSTGTLVAASSTALGTTAAGTSVTSGATLALSGGITIGTEALSLGGTGSGTNGAIRNLSGNNSYGGALTLTADTEIQSDADTVTLTGNINGNAAGRDLAVDGAGNTTITGTIGANVGVNATNSLVKTGTGTLTLGGTGANTYVGTTVVSGGTLVAAKASALGATGAGNATTVASGATLALNGVNIGAEALTLNGTGVGNQGTLRALSGTNTVGGTVALGSESWIGTAAGSTLAVNGVVSGGFGLTKLGDGTLTLAASNTYTGTTAVTAGTLVATNAGSLGTTGNPTTITSGATLAFSGTFTSGEPITLAGAGVAGAGGLQGLSGTTTLGANVTMNADSTIGVSNGATLRLNGLLGEESGSDYNLVKAGEGTLALAANNTYNGTTTVRAGTLLVEANAPVTATGALGNASSFVQLGDSGSGSSPITLALGNTTGGLEIARSITVNNQGGTVTLAGTNTSNTNTFSGLVSLQKDASVSAAAGGTVAFTNAISGSGGLTKTGDGIVTLSGPNAYAGATTVSTGTLIAANSTALGTTTSGTTIASGATLGLQGNIVIAAGEGITVGGTGATGNGAIRNVSGDNTLSGPVTLTSATSLGSTSGILTVAGAVSGAQNLTTTGAGAITFTGTNTNSGTLTIANGTTTLANTTGQAFGSVTGVTVNGATSVLALGAANQINDSANLTLSNGGTLNVGSFSETLRTLTVTNSGRINYLDDGSALTFNGDGSVNGLNGTIGGTLSIDNWAGSLDGGGTEQLIVRSTTALTGTIAGINFSDWGTGDNNTVISLGGGLYEIVPLVSGTYWDVNGNGNWDATNWDNGSNIAVGGPNTADSIAILGDRIGVGGAKTALTVDPTITMNSARTVGKLIFENSADRNYTISGTQALNFDVGSGSSQIIVNDNGSHRIAFTNTANSNDDLLITNNSAAAVGLDIDSSFQMQDTGDDVTFNGSGTTRFDGDLLRRGSRTNALTKTGSGNLIIGSAASNYTGVTTIRSGSVILESSALNNTVGAFGDASSAIVLNDASTSASSDSALLIGANSVELGRAVTVGAQGASTTLGGADSLTTGTAVFSGAITLNKSVNLSAAGTSTVTFSGQLINGDGATALQNITKTGSGTVVLSNASNNYDGTTTVSAGTLRLGVANAVPTGSAVTVESGATFDANSLTATLGSLAGAGSLTLGNAATTLTAGGNGQSTTFSGVISGGTGAQFAKAGVGTLTLSGANTYAGVTTVTQGTLVAANNTALGTTAGNTVVNTTGTLALSGGINIGAEAVTLNATGGTNSLYNLAGDNTSTGAITLVNSGNLVRVGAASGTTLSLGGVIGESGGAQGITKTDLGTVILSGANTYTGQTQILAGTVVAANNTALGTAAAGTTVSAGATLGLQNNISLASGETFSLGAALTPSAPSLSNRSGDNTAAGAITLTGNVNTGVQIDVATGSSLALNGAISQTGGAKYVTKTGEGTLTLGGGANNTFTGGFNINEGVVVAQKTPGFTATGQGEVFIGDSTGAANSATLRLGAANQIWDSSDLTIRTDGRLDLQANNETVRAVTMNGGSVTGTGTLTLGGNLTFNGVGTATSSVSSNLALGATNRIVQVGNNGINGDSDMVISGVVSGTGQTLRKTDLGTLELTGTSSNTFTGGLQVDDGVVLLNKSAGLNAIGGGPVTLGDGLLGANTAIVRYGADNQLPDSTDLVFRSDGLLDMNGRTDRIDEIDSFVAGNGHILIGTGQLIVGSTNGDSVYSGLLTGTEGGVLEKVGTGTLTFSDADTLRADRVMDFGGELKLEAGTLALDNITLNVDTLRLTGDSVIDFGGSSILNVNTLIVELASGETTFITNWSEFVDYFYAQEFFDGEGGPLVPFDTRGQAPQNRIVFDGWTGNNTWWQSGDKQVNPVPEPSTYGLLALGGLLGSTLLRRRKRAVPAI